MFFGGGGGVQGLEFGVQVSKQQRQEQLWGVHCHAAVECGHPQLRERPEGSEAKSSSEAFVNASWGFNGFH